MEDLQWYEAVFHALTLFVEKTFAEPTFSQFTSLCYLVHVCTHAGWTTVTLTVPPVASPPTPQVWVFIHSL